MLNSITRHSTISNFSNLSFLSPKRNPIPRKAPSKCPSILRNRMSVIGVANRYRVAMLTCGVRQILPKEV
jgi:hypothetical protein